MHKIFKGKIKSYSVDIEKGPQQMLNSGQWDATSQLIRQEKKLTERINKLLKIVLILTTRLQTLY